MTDAEFIRKTETLIAELVKGVSDNTPYTVLNVHLRHDGSVTVSIELKKEAK